MQVKSAARVLDILELLAVAPVPLGISEITRRLGMAKSSAFALLATLEGRGYVERRDGKKYALSPALSETSNWVGGLGGLLLRLARPEMRALVVRTRESSFLGILTKDFRVQYIAKAISPQEIRYDADISKICPPHCTSIGLTLLAYQPRINVERSVLQEPLHAFTSKTITDPRVLLDELAKIKLNGYAMTVDAHYVGATGVAMPIFDSHSKVLAALNVSAPTSRFDAECETLKLELSKAVANISRFFTAPAVAPAEMAS